MTEADSHTIALKNNGTLWSWGYNFSGQLGNGTNTSQYVPSQIGNATSWNDIVAGPGFTMSIKNNELWTWGRNDYGQLGNGATEGRNFPAQVSIPCSIPGDLNGDSCVDRTDYSILMTDVRGSEPHDPDHDLNGDGLVNISDGRYIATLFTNPRGAPCQ